MVKNQCEQTDRHYSIVLIGHLDESWADWFEGLTFSYGCDGTTILSGPVADQAALHGILKRIRDLGLPLLAVNPVAQNSG